MLARPRAAARHVRIWCGVVLLGLAGAGCGKPGEPPVSSVARVGAMADPSTTASQPGDVRPEPSTFHSLAVRWPVRGDANANAQVGVLYRRSGEIDWRAGLPLFRVTPESASPENRVAGGWLFAGSIVDLVPDTEYEVRLSLRDPDGGAVDRILTMRTLAEPRQPSGMRTLYVVPVGQGPGGTGTAEDPFRGLAAAQASARPGDLFIVRPGVY